MSRLKLSYRRIFHKPLNKPKSSTYLSEIKMCNYFSGIITKAGEVLWLRENPSDHEAIKATYKLTDDKEGKDYVLFEITPKDKKQLLTCKTWKDIKAEDWQFKIDSLNAPDWFEQKATVLIANAFQAWEQSKLMHLLPAEETRQRLASNECIAIMWGSSVVKEMWDSSVVEEMWGSSVVEEMRGSSVVEAMWGSSVVEAMWGSSVVKEMWGSSVVKEMWNSSVVKAMRGSSVVKEMRDSSVVKEMWNSSVVEAMWDSSVVEEMRDSSVVKEMWNSSVVEAMWDSSVVEEMRGSSVVEEMRDSSVVKEMWDSSVVKEMRDSSVARKQMAIYVACNARVEKVGYVP